MFHNLIRERRRELGLSQTQLARLVGVAESTMSDFELGKRKAWPKAKMALASVLGRTVRELFPDESR